MHISKLSQGGASGGAPDPRSIIPDEPRPSIPSRVALRVVHREERRFLSHPRVELPDGTVIAGIASIEIKPGVSGGLELVLRVTDFDVDIESTCTRASAIAKSAESL